MQVYARDLTVSICTPLGLVQLAVLEDPVPKANLAEQSAADAILCMLCLGGGIQGHSGRPQAMPHC